MAFDVDEFDVISAMWIFASNDKNPLITLKGIRFRLNLPEDYPVEDLVNKRGELFRRPTDPTALNEWKDRMRKGAEIPSWIRTISDRKKRDDTIDSLDLKDVFRSQFRPTKDADTSPIDLIKWGLEHIERLRKAAAEARDAHAKSWQMWLVFWVGMAGIAVSIVNLVISIVTGNQIKGK